MLIIKKLSKMIKEEINDAGKYADCALNHKESDKVLADVFYQLATEELEHMEKLHAQVVRLIESYKKENGEPPETMKVLYNYIHEEEIEAVKEVRVKLGLYKG